MRKVPAAPAGPSAIVWGGCRGFHFPALWSKNRAASLPPVCALCSSWC